MTTCYFSCKKRKKMQPHWKKQRLNSLKPLKAIINHYKKYYEP